MEIMLEKENIFASSEEKVDFDSCILDICDCSNGPGPCCDEGGCWDHCCSSYGD